MPSAGGVRIDRRREPVHHRRPQRHRSAAGQERKNLNFDFVDSIEVKTGGLDAEYGRMTGGIVNVVTKSGGNTFRGSLFGFNSGGACSRTTTRHRSPADDDDRRRNRPAVGLRRQLGGYIVKDKLWFFGSYAHMFRRTRRRHPRALGARRPTSAPRSQPTTTATCSRARSPTRWAASTPWSGRSTATRARATATSSPCQARSRREGHAEHRRSGRDGELHGRLRRGIVVNGIYGATTRSRRLAGPGENIAQLIDQTVSPNIRDRRLNGIREREYSRNFYKIKATKYLAGHEIKGGIDWEDNQQCHRPVPGRRRRHRTTSCRERRRTIYYRHRLLRQRSRAGLRPGRSDHVDRRCPADLEPKTQNTSFFVQDSWRVASNLTINAGIRWERQQSQGPRQRHVDRSDDNWAPRIGSCGTSRRTAAARSSSTTAASTRASRWTSTSARSAASSPASATTSIRTRPTALPDPAARHDHSLLGGATAGRSEPAGAVHRRVHGRRRVRSGAELQRQRRSTCAATSARVIEDFLVPPRAVLHRQPRRGAGQGRWRSTRTDSAGTTGVAAPKAKRMNHSVEFTARKRFSNNWQFLASYVWSKLEGNYDGDVPELDRPARSEHQLGVRLRGLPHQRQGKLLERPRAPDQVDGSYKF